MVMPMVDPEKLARVQEVSKNITGSIRIDYKECTVLLKLQSDVDSAKRLIPDMMTQFGQNLATQLSSFFAIKGEIVEVNKGGEEVHEKSS